MRGYRLNKRQPLSEAIKQQNKLFHKYEEYSKKSLEELLEMLPILGGGYKVACQEAIKAKKLEQLKSNQTEEIPEGEI